MRCRSGAWRAGIMASVGIATIGSPGAAWAYQTVRVGSSGATVFANPQSDSSTTGTLNPGQVVNIGDQPRGGYYRATAAGGISGWVQEDALIIPANHQHLANPATSTGSQKVAKSTPSFRGAPTQYYVGALAGLGIAGGGTSMGFGIDGGYKLSNEWGLGAYFQYLSLASATASTTGTTSTGAAATGTASASASILMLAGEVNYFVPQVDGLHFGGKIGLGFASASATTSSTVSGTSTPANSFSSSSIAFGGALGGGYDYPITQILSIGGEGNFFFVTGDLASTLVNVLATVKYNF